MAAAFDRTWLPWSGGNRPVRPETRVEVRFRDGDSREGVRSKVARSYIWTHGGFAEDIIAYRVSPTPESGKDR